MTTAGPGTRRHELAAFLRSRRERITPEQVGLPRGRRRRTPGLRREEVAHLSAVGVTWYTWLEQARDITVSPQVLDALADALLLDPTERSHLFALAGQSDPHPGATCPAVTPALRELLRQLEPVPACVQNSRYDFLAYNRTFGRLYCDLDALPREDRNTLWLAFTHDDFRAAFGDLPEVLRAMVGKLRASMAEHLAEPAWKALVQRLQDASRNSASSGNGATSPTSPAAPRSSATPGWAYCTWSTPTSGSGRPRAAPGHVRSPRRGVPGAARAAPGARRARGDPGGAGPHGRLSGRPVPSAVRGPSSVSRHRAVRSAVRRAHFPLVSAPTARTASPHAVTTQ